MRKVDVSTIPLLIRLIYFFFIKDSLNEKSKTKNPNKLKVISIALIKAATPFFPFSLKLFITMWFRRSLVMIIGGATNSPLTYYHITNIIICLCFVI